MKDLTKEEFETKLNSGEKFIVDFHARWCSPCVMMMPIVEMVSNKLKNESSSVNIYKFDIESDRDLVVKLGIRGVPTVKAFNNGEEVFSKSGLMREDELMNIAKNVLHG